MSCFTIYFITLNYKTRTVSFRFFALIQNDVVPDLIDQVMSRAWFC